MGMGRKGVREMLSEARRWRRLMGVKKVGTFLGIVSGDWRGGDDDDDDDDGCGGGGVWEANVVDILFSLSMLQ